MTAVSTFSMRRGSARPRADVSTVGPCLSRYNGAQINPPQSQNQQRRARMTWAEAGTVEDDPRGENYCHYIGAKARPNAPTTPGSQRRCTSSYVERFGDGPGRRQKHCTLTGCRGNRLIERYVLRQDVWHPWITLDHTPTPVYSKGNQVAPPGQHHTRRAAAPVTPPGRTTPVNGYRVCKRPFPSR